MPAYSTCPCGEEMMTMGDNWGTDWGDPGTCGHCNKWEYWQGRGWQTIPISKQIMRRVRVALVLLRARLKRTD